MPPTKSKLWLFFVLFLGFAHAKAAAEATYPIGEIDDPSWINIRRGEAAHSPVIGRVRKGESFAVQSAGSRFRILDGPYAGGYIAAEFVRLSGQQFPLVKSTASGVLIRAYPSLNGRNVASVNKNAYFAAVKNGDWFEIKDGPFRGRFVSAKFARAIEESGSEATQATPMVSTQLSAAPMEEAPPAVAAPAAAPEPVPPGPAEPPAPASPSAPVAEPTSAAPAAEAAPAPEPGPPATPATAPAEPAPAPEPPAAAAQPAASPQPSASAPEPPPAAPAPPAPQPPASPAPAAKVEKARLSGTNINVRKAPSVVGKIAGILKGNEQLEVAKKGDWYEIKSGPFAGNFINGWFVKPVEDPPPAPAKPANKTPFPEAQRWDQKEDQRFNEQVAKLFKKKKDADNNQVVMPVQYEDSKNPVGYVNMRVTGDKGAELDVNEFRAILRKHVTESWFEKTEVRAILENKDTARGPWVPVQAFAGSGVTVLYDELRLEIRLQVPPALRNTEIVSVDQQREIWGVEKPDAPAALSSYLNINATQVFDSRSDIYKDSRSPLQAQLESGTNIANFVLEAYGTYTENRGGNLGEKNSFLRQDVRLVRDFPDAASRAAIGDVLYPVQSFQVYRPLQGVSVYKQFSMGQSKLTYPTGNYEIFLKTKSKVNIWVNDQLQKVVELPAGRHQLKDFQYTSGMNNVRFEIIDEFGQMEIQDHSYSASTELLKPGIHQFSYAAGNPSSADLTTGERVYNSSNTTYSGFHRYGFSDYFTGGLNAQGDSKQSLFGAESSFSLKTGYLKVEYGYSSTAQVGSGHALAGRYTYLDYNGPDKTQRSLNLGVTYRSDFFSELGNVTAPAVARVLDFSLGYSRGITKMLAASFGANYILNKKITADAENSFALRAGVSNRWKNGIAGNVSVSHTKNASGGNEIALMAFMIWSFPKEKQAISAYTNTSDGSSRAGWNYSPSNGADTNAYQADYRETNSEKGYSVTLQRNGNRARTVATHEVVLGKIDEPTTDIDETKRASNVTTLQMGTALVFAGGRFGIGRPVSDAFAIISPVKSLKGKTLLVNPDTEGNYLAKTDWLGPAVMPEIASYNPTKLNIIGKDLPLGVSVPQDHFNLYPRYKNGYGFAIGSDANIYLQAALKDSKGESIGMASGIAINLDKPDMAPVTVFTSRKGILQSEGFSRGRYRLEIATDRFQPVEFVLPENAKEEYDLGTLHLKEK